MCVGRRRVVTGVGVRGCVQDWVDEVAGDVECRGRGTLPTWGWGRTWCGRGAARSIRGGEPASYAISVGAAALNRRYVAS